MVEEQASHVKIDNPNIYADGALLKAKSITIEFPADGHGFTKFYIDTGAIAERKVTVEGYPFVGHTDEGPIIMPRPLETGGWPDGFSLAEELRDEESAVPAKVRITIEVLDDNP